jgi:hypothetical protein
MFIPKEAMRVRFIDMVLAAQTFVHEVRRCSCTIGATAVAVGRIGGGSNLGGALAIFCLLVFF